MRILVLPLLAGVLALSNSNAERLATGLAIPGDSSLYTQAAGQIISREFGECEGSSQAKCSAADDISYLLLDARTGTLLASRWTNPEFPIPLGSLVKPFAALAYGEQHEFKFPTYICRGASTGCWLPRGHGEVGLKSAVADSCNSYFRMLTAHMSRADVTPIATSFGLQAPERNSAGANFAGLGGHWSISPLSMARGYLELIRRREQPGVREVLAGMAESARNGTAAEVDGALKRSDALAKTGTAVCTHRKHAPGDGFAIALMPAENPEILLMVRVHGVPGARAAKTAGEMLREIEE